MKTLTQLRDIYSQLSDFENDEIREFIENIGDDDFYFSGDNYRAIKEDCIDQIQCDELESDPYTLGCFTDWFIADNTDLSYNIVKALQKGGQYEAIGNHIIDNHYLSDIQQAYQSADGYGNHFSHYDGSELQISFELDGELFTYYIFRVN